MIKTVKDIIKNYKSTIEVFGSLDKQISFLTLDSREVKKDALFFAVKGTSTDAHQYIPNVIEMGASVIVCSTLPIDINSDVTYLLVEDVQQQWRCDGAFFAKKRVEMAGGSQKLG